MASSVKSMLALSVAFFSVFFFLLTGRRQADCSFLDEYPLYVDQFITPQGKMLYIYMSTWCPRHFDRGRRRERERKKDGDGGKKTLRPRVDHELARALLSCAFPRALPVIIKSSLTKPSIACIIYVM